jgi:cytochrome c556
MKRTLFAIMAIAVGAGAAIAQGDVVNQRQTILKSFGAGVKDPGAMLRGEAPFELAKVKAALATIKDGAPKLPALFPDASLGGTSRALPLIGQERDKFVAIYAKLGADAAAADAAITNEATFKAEFGKVLANCGACHRSYLKPQ